MTDSPIAVSLAMTADEAHTVELALRREARALSRHDTGPAVLRRRLPVPRSAIEESEARAKRLAVCLEERVADNTMRSHT